MIKNPHISTIACLAALTLCTAHGKHHEKETETGPNTDSKGKPTSNKPVADENDPNAVMGGQKKESEQNQDEAKRGGKGHRRERKAIEPAESSGKPTFDLSSQRETELFQSGDVIFVREGASTHLTAYPKHEADTRFVEITDRKSSFDSDTGKTKTNIELTDGTKVLIDGHAVTVTPKDGDPEAGGPDLNAHGINETLG